MLALQTCLPQPGKRRQVRGDDCDASTGVWQLLSRNPSVPNFDGSINTDDGRLNFDKGDIYSSPFRLTTEVEAANGPWTVFGRLNIWHDITAMDEDAYNRGGELTDDGEENVKQNIELLDAYVSYDGDVFDMPFTLRAGRQVINWGEATFIPAAATRPLIQLTLLSCVARVRKSKKLCFR